MSRRPPAAGSAKGPKPRVLLVDDHRDILDRLSTMLAGDFEIAGTANDGHQGVEVAREVSPDLIVLDVNMPRLDGFQTIAALTDAGSRAPVVFLSLLDDDETVSEAFRLGGRGYVVKSRLSRDLKPALEHVRHGRVVAPSLTSMLRVSSGPAHTMHIYGDLPAFLDALAALFHEALRRGDATSVIASADIREGLQARLRDRGWRLDGHTRFRSLDATDALNSFMRNGMPDANLLANIAAELEQYRLSETAEGQGQLTIFGNMAGTLTANGNVDGAMELERQWGALTKDLPFLTVCGYDAACFDNDTGLFSGACTHHGALSQAQ